jgi:hypothetical protein
VSVGRLKRSAADSGKVYEYYFAGQGPARSAPGATEYLFQASPDRHTFAAIQVVLLAESVEEWSRRHGRPLADPERFAAAKLRLLRAFDEFEAPAEAGVLAIGPEELEELLAPLDL